MNTLRVTEVWCDARLTVLAVEAVELERFPRANGGQILGGLKPVAVVVSGPDGIRALDTSGQPTDLQWLRANVPDIDLLAASLR